MEHSTRSPWPVARARYRAATVATAAWMPAHGSGSDMGKSVGPPPTGPFMAATPDRASMTEP